MTLAAVQGTLLGGRLQLHGGIWRPKRGFAALLGTLLGPWWQAAAARRHLKAEAGLCRASWHPSWALVAGCSCTEPFEACPGARRHLKAGRAAGSKPAKKWFSGPCKAPWWQAAAARRCSKTSVFIRGFEGGRRPSNLGTMLAVCWAYVGLCWANVWPVLPAN